jgi:hypothetical protein
MVDRVLFDWRKFEEEKDPEAIWRGGDKMRAATLGNKSVLDRSFT